MRRFTFPHALNVHGADTKSLLYQGINASHPQLGLTVDNSKIILTQGFGNPSNQNEAILVIQKGDDREDVYSFVYDRQPLSDLLVNPALSQQEIAHVVTLHSSEDLVDWLAVKLNRQLTAADIWCNPNQIEDAGGTSEPNWFMQTRYNSLAFCGQMILWLHL